MADERIRRQLAFLAAQMMYHRTESEYFTAKRKAAKQLGIEYRHRPGDLPSNKEIRDQIQVMARIHEGPKRLEHLRDMRLDALRLMRLLARFRPRLIGSVRTGHVRKGSDIDIHLFCDSQSLVTATLDELGLQYDVERKRIVKYGEERTFTHIHIYDRSQLRADPLPGRQGPLRLQELDHRQGDRAGLDRRAGGAAARGEPGAEPGRGGRSGSRTTSTASPLYRMLLEPLEGVKQSPKYHPEGDALYHSLQVFELAREERPYDEEFLLAALLHDVGKAIDPADHVERGPSGDRRFGQRANRVADRASYGGSTLSRQHLGSAARIRLQNSEWFDDLMLLNELDRRGRVRGAIVCELEEAFDYIRELDQESRHE